MDSQQKDEQMHYYNMKAVVQETGLNPVTIRTWERRYGLPQPGRSAGGHRQYTQRDIEIFKWLIARQEEGLSVRHAAEQWRALEAQGKDPLTSAEPMQAASTPPAIGSEAGNQLDQLRAQWIAAGLAFDREAAERAVTQALSYFPPEIVCVELLQKGIAQIGKGWYYGEVTIQQEHFATALAVRRLEALVAATPQPQRSARVLVFCAPDDHHIFSPLLLTFLLLRRGWDVLYLGANVPHAALSTTIAQIEPKLVVISAQRLHSAANLRDVASQLQEHKVMVGYGGRIFNQAPAVRQHIPGYFLGESLSVALNQIETLLTTDKNSLQTQPTERNCSHQHALQQFTSRRTMLESHVWGTFIANGKPVDDLMPINAEMALTIMAALRLGSMDLLGSDRAWIDDLLISYRPAPEYVREYLRAYHQAAKIHLGEAALTVTDWLAALTSAYESAEPHST